MVGGGPAGRALAAGCAARGLRTVLLDRVPDTPWRATYGAWSAELPAGLPGELVAATASGRVVAVDEHRLGWDYAVLDVPALRAHLDARMAAGGVRVRAGRAVGSPSPGLVELAGGTTLRAAVVVDAGGAGQPLRTGNPATSSGAVEWARGGGAYGRPHPANPGPGLERDAHDCDPHPGRRDPDTGHPARDSDRPEPAAARRRNHPAAEQTAFGVIVPIEQAAPLVAPGEALFMDWRPEHGEPGWPTFLYAVPLDAHRVLLEETSLARRPGLPLPVLRRRLYARLARYGIVPIAGAATERVRFPVDTPRHPGRHVLGFGAAAPLIHPASGFSVATALGLAPLVADAIAGGLAVGPAAAQRRAQATVWPAEAQLVHRFRRIGLEALLRMPPAEVPRFFDRFFALAERHRWSYLTVRDDLPATAATMTALFARADWSLRARLMAPALLPPAPPIAERAGVRPGSRGRAAAPARPR